MIGIQSFSKQETLLS